MAPVAIDDLTELAIGCAIAVHDALGPGLLESIYRDCLVVELRAHELDLQLERHVPVFYRGVQAHDDLQLDILVDGRVIIEVKAVERLHPVHLAQLITYLKLADVPAGLLMNFNAPSLRAGLRRADHPDLHKARTAGSRAPKPSQPSGRGPSSRE